MVKYPLKLIEWQDASSGNHEWFPAEELLDAKPHIVMTMGFEVQRTDSHVTLAMAVSANGNLCSLFTIPLGMIVREQTFRSRLK